MNNNLSEIEPSADKCDNCNWQHDSYHTVNILQSDTTLCLKCLLNRELTDQQKQNLREEIILDVTEGEYEQHESGYISEGFFGRYIVEFNTNRNAKVYNQVAVDHFKEIGAYTELKGSGTITLDEPKYGNTGFKTTKKRDEINEQRQEQAIDERR